MSRQDYHAYFTAIDRLVAVDNTPDCMHCLRREILPMCGFGCLIGGLGRVSDRKVYPELLLNEGFPLEYVKEIRAADGSVTCPMLEKWLGSAAPLTLDFSAACDEPSPNSEAQSRRFDLGITLAHGHYSPATGMLTYFSFHRLAEPVTPELCLMMARLMPHIHCALARIHAGRGATPVLDRLSERQRQIAGWLMRGKTNWEIGQITGTSEANVKYHLGNLMRMFSVCTRSSLVFKLCQAAEVSALM